MDQNSDRIVHTRVPYGVNSQKAIQLLFAGFISILCMMALSYILRAFNIGSPDFGARYGAIFNHQQAPYPFTTLWSLGLAWHALDGIVIFSFLFDFLSHTMVLPAGKRTKGFIYGALIWLFVAVIIAPLSGEGFFFRMAVHPWQTGICSLLCWVFYGYLLDEMTRIRVVHSLGISEKQAA